jgi:hypothetical protein
MVNNSGKEGVDRTKERSPPVVVNNYREKILVLKWLITTVRKFQNSKLGRVILHKVTKCFGGTEKFGHKQINMLPGLTGM